MARYKLMCCTSLGDETEVGGQRKNTKKEIAAWISDNIRACGLDWQAGTTVKFKSSELIYVWRWIKNNKRLEKYEESHESRLRSKASYKMLTPQKGGS